MPDPSALQRPARLALACLAVTVLLPMPALLHDLRVREGAEAVQAAEDRLRDLGSRLDGRQADGGPLGLAEDVALRRAVGDVLQVLRRESAWVPGLDQVDLRLRIDRWFVDRGDARAISDLSGAVRAAVRRSRAELQVARWVSVAVCCVALAPAVTGALALLRLLRRLRRLEERPVPRLSVPPPAPRSVLPPTPPSPMPRAQPPAPTPLLRRMAAPESSSLPGVVGPLRGRVLVIEDNPINQRVTQRQLAELALTVEIAPDAETGLMRMAEERWDAVLMDLQLPGIDGLTATSRWRATEAAGGGRRIPIVAVTANALGTDREACFAAGMDGYLAKPARLEDFYRALVRFLGTSAPPPSPQVGMPLFPLPAPVGGLPLTDPGLWAKLRSETATSDPRMLEELMDDLRTQVGGQLAELKEAHGSGDWERLRSIAHRLKGSAGMLGLPRLSAAAKGVEYAAKAQEAERGQEALGELALAISETMADPAVSALR